MTHEEILKQAKDALDKAIEQKKSNEMLLKSIGPAVIDAIKPVLNQIKEAVSAIRVDVKPIIEVNPKMDMPRIPAPEVTVNVPDFPKIPEPKVTVNVPPIKIPDLQWPKDKMPIEGWVQLMGVSLQNPLPVQIRDASGKPVDFSGGVTQVMGGSGGGGKADFFTIKGFSQSAFADYLNNDGRLKVSAEENIIGVVSTVNSTTTNLGIDGVFTGTAEDIKDYVTVNVVVKSDVASATDGLSLQFSPDGTNWDIPLETHTIAAGTGLAHLSRAKARYFRVVYTNGGVAQTYFRLSTIYKKEAVSFTFEQLDSVINDQHDAAVVRAVLNAKNPAGVYGNINRTTGGNLKVSIEELGGPALDVRQVSGAIDSVYVTGFGASVAASIVDSSGVQYSGSNPLPITVVSGALTSTISVGATLHDSADDGDAPLKVGGIAMQTNPTPVANGDRVSFRADDLGRQLVRPVQVRDLTVTAYATLTTGTETTLLAASAGSFHDLIYVMGANNSDAAVTVDIRPVTAGNVVMSIRVPANGTAGVSLAVPYPQSGSDTGNAWTADLPDVTGTTVYLSALFSREI